jgi:hypothetical protein
MTEQTRPSLLVQGRSLLKFARSALRHGFGMASQRDRESRLLTCHKCPKLTVNSRRRPACGVCGCPIKARIFPASSFCPDEPKRWDVVKAGPWTSGLKYMIQSIYERRGFRK